MHLSCLAVACWSCYSHCTSQVDFINNTAVGRIGVGGGAFVVQNGVYGGRSVLFRGNRYTPGGNPPSEGANHMLPLHISGLQPAVVVFNSTTIEAGPTEFAVSDVNSSPEPSAFSFCDSTFTPNSNLENVTILTGTGTVTVCDSTPDWVASPSNSVPENCVSCSAASSVQCIP